MTFHYFMYK